MLKTMKGVVSNAKMEMRRNHVSVTNVINGQNTVLPIEFLGMFPLDPHLEATHPMNCLWHTCSFLGALIL